VKTIKMVDCDCGLCLWPRLYAGLIWWQRR